MRICPDAAGGPARTVIAARCNQHERLPVRIHWPTTCYQANDPGKPQNLEDWAYTVGDSHLPESPTSLAGNPTCRILRRVVCLRPREGESLRWTHRQWVESGRTGSALTPRMDVAHLFSRRLIKSSFAIAKGTGREETTGSTDRSRKSEHAWYVWRWRWYAISSDLRGRL